MTRDEFKLQRLKDDATMIRRVYPVLLGCVMCFAILCIYAFVAGKPSAGLGGTLIMLSIALRLPPMRRQIDTYDDAIREFEAHIKDPSVPLSEDTEAAVATSDYPSVELLKGWIGLGIMVVTLLGLGVLVGVLSKGEDIMFIVFGTGLIVGGIIVSFPTARLYHSWKTARELEREGL